MLTRPARDVEPSRVVDAVEHGMRTTVGDGCPLWHGLPQHEQGWLLRRRRHTGQGWRPAAQGSVPTQPGTCGSSSPRSPLSTSGSGHNPFSSAVPLSPFGLPSPSCCEAQSEPPRHRFALPSACRATTSSACCPSPAPTTCPCPAWASRSRTGSKTRMWRSPCPARWVAGLGGGGGGSPFRDSQAGQHAACAKEESLAHRGRQRAA